MSILQMSFSGAILILAILIFRAIFIYKLPKNTFIILWKVALLRLLLPFSIPSVFSAYSLLNHYAPAVMDEFSTTHLLPEATVLSTSTAPSIPVRTIMATMPATAATPTGPVLHLSIPLLPLIWGLGTILCALWFTVSYFRLLQEFKTSLPISNPFLDAWLKEHPSVRTIQIRQSDRISAPLTYGIFHPVILMPKCIDWNDTEQLSYILLHEYTHIRHYDTVFKLLMAATLCIHWFNPAVFIMYILFNRDLELTCDERVIKKSGKDSRSAYAMTLIYMEEQKRNLSPFYSSFSKNDIEKRILSIMKTREFSLIAILIAGAFVTGISTVFATSAEQPEKTALTNYEVFSESLSKEEIKKLLLLQIENYGNMAISDYRQAMWVQIDSPEILSILERFSKLEPEYKYLNDLENETWNNFLDYYYSIFEPLTAKDWQTSFFNGTAVSPEPYYASVENLAQLEYVLTLTVLHADQLTVSDYDQTRRNAIYALDSLLYNFSYEELIDEETIFPSLQRAIKEIEESLSTNNLKLSIEFSYIPLSIFENQGSDYLDNEFMQIYWDDNQAYWDELLSPYFPFGLTYEYHPGNGGINNEITMYYQDQEVRGIFDPEEQMWISEHAGISTYPANAIELYAIYQNHQLIGLRPATRQEQSDWDQSRNKATQGIPSGSQEDYDSLLSLNTPEIQEMPIKEFNYILLDWCNLNFDAMERIGTDTMLQRYPIELTESDRNFITLTFPLSREENHCMVTSLQTGEPQNNIFVRGDKVYKNSTSGAWCSLYYQFSYQISDTNKLTVSERDYCIGGMVQSIQEFWENTELRELIELNEKDIISLFEELARQYSTDLLTIYIDEERIQFEHRLQ